MIYPKHMEEEVKKFCDICGIPILGGSIQREHVKTIENFVYSKMRTDRLITKRSEEINEGHVGTILNSILKNNIFDSPIEEFMAKAMEQHGLLKHAKTQYEIGTKRVDFAFPVARLVVECDGMEYHFSDQEQIEKDQKRDIYLARKGWRVLHIEGLAIRRNIGLCIEKIKNELNPFLNND